MPNVLFNPWVRWDTWPGLGREFFRRRRRRRRRRPSDFKLEIWKFQKWNVGIGNTQVCLFFIRGIPEPPG